MTEKLSPALESINGVVIPLELEKLSALKDALAGKNSRLVDQVIEDALKASTHISRTRALELIKTRLQNADWYESS